MANGSVWNPDNIRDVSESVGIASLTQEAVDHLTRDVEFRIAQILEEALKFMRHAKRTTLHTTDVSQALRALDIEPLYGYESTRPLKFGEASIGPGQPLYYLEDEEVDFEKLINAPLPKVPREITFTAHWLAVEGVQPSIPQNPAPADTTGAQHNLLPRGPGANPHLAATAGADNLSVKPLVKHVLSKELQLYFEHVCAALLDENNAEYRNAALSSLRDDPGLHQLVPYFVHYVSEKVTHGLKNIFVLTQMLLLLSSLLNNGHLHIAPYVAAVVPSILTCLVGKWLGSPPTSSSSFATALGLPNGIHTNHASLPDHYALRDLAASLLQSLTRPEFTDATPTLQPRLARTLLKHLLAPTLQPLGSYYGAIRGLSKIAGADGVRMLLLPNVKAFDSVYQETLDKAEVDDEKQQKRREIEVVINATVESLSMLEQDHSAGDDFHMDGVESGNEGLLGEAERKSLAEKIGETVAERLWASGRMDLVRAVLKQDV